MKQVLTVEGKQHDILYASYREDGVPKSAIVTKDGFQKSFHDFSHDADPLMNSTAIDMSKAYSIVDDRADKIRARIEALEETMIELAMEYIQHEGPFAEKGDLQKEWHQLNEQVKGLWQALEIVEGKEHDESVLQRFTQGVVKAAVELAKDVPNAM